MRPALSERRAASLLDFAIAASIAVLPVLLGVVLLVAVIRPADVEASGKSPQERYLSVRLIAALRPVILAGGLTPGNVATAIHEARPYAVDVSSGVERSPGVKDHHRLAAFVAAVRAEA